MFQSFRKALLALGALGALALGGSALADAASNGSSGSSGQSGTAPAATSGQPPANAPQGAPPNGGQRPDPTKPGGRQANGKTEEALSSDVAAKVKAAALAKVPGATFERAETDVDNGSPYEAHLRKSDGTELEVLVNKDFQVTAVNTMQHP